MRMESTNVTTGACSILAGISSSEYSAALFNPQGMATPDGSTMIMSGLKVLYKVATVVAKLPAI